MPPITSFFSKATPEQIVEQDQRGAEEIRHRRNWQKAREMVVPVEKVQRDQQGAIERKRKHRQRRKAMVLKSESSTDTPVLPANSDSLASLPPSKKRRTSRTNWYELAHWTLIALTARHTGFSSPKDIVHALQKGSSGALFKTLDCGTVGHWINKERTGWTQAVLDRVAWAAAADTSAAVLRKASPGKKFGPPARLDPYPSVRVKVVTLLTNLRLACVVITRAVAQGIILGVIRTDAPDLFRDSQFRCSNSFVRRLLRGWLDWSWHTATQAAQKLPDNWEDLCLDLAHRLTWNITVHKVPPQLIINADQTGVSYLGPGSKTWELKGSAQVPAIGQGEKRQFTLMAAVTAAGQVLPFQTIYKGQTKDSLPSEAARKVCELLGFLFTSGGDKHWSSFESMKEWVIKVLAKFIEDERIRLGLPPEQRAILLIDCWAVHRGQEFRSWMKKNYPRIIVHFIPGGCTGVAQPCDTNVNRVLKHCIKSACIEYLSNTTQSQLDRGVKPSNIEIDTTLPTLHNASVAWILSAWTWLNEHPKVILDAWRLAAFKGLDLSYETLTSAKNQSTVYERWSDDQAFGLSVLDISKQLPDNPDFEEAEGCDYNDDYAIDPTLLCDICRDMLPASVVESGGDLGYVGDENLTNDKAEAGDSGCTGL
ncbi:hypothetical protein FS749_014953 [Ceratobasidium sp. UAMH 11750]|nr:hypothetical protein FS749_014953 [Ceratobasidium sp. UAMH 11750]